MDIGVLAIQGDFDAHIKMFNRLEGVNARPVRTPDELMSVEALVLPGGESTTVGKLLRRFELDDLIRQRVKTGMPVYGTCAGMILMAKEIEDSQQDHLGIMNIGVARNAFGRQIDSFEADILVPTIGDEPIRGVFIRAPYVKSVETDVDIIARYDGKIVAVRQGKMLASAFHPELTSDSRFHEMFVKMVRQTD